MVYLFLGSDSLSKDTQLSLIKEQFLPKETEQFNLDVLYARDLSLKALQEKLLYIPTKNSKRVIVIKNCQDLKEELKEFILSFASSSSQQVILVLDIAQTSRKDEFVNQLSKFAKTYRFREVVKPDTFALSRQISFKKPDMALRILSQLLQDGERPERILGGLRYVWEKEAMSGAEAKRRLALLLACDTEIKTGRLRPVFALEKLVVNLCGLSKPLG
jgi:DNA polymerase III delta subunit